MIHGTDQIHPLLQGHRVACQRTAAACQRRQTLATGRVEPLPVGGVEHPVTLRTRAEGLDARRWAIDEAAFDLDHPPLGIVLDDRRDTDMTPGTSPRAS